MLVIQNTNEIFAISAAEADAAFNFLEIRTDDDCVTMSGGTIAPQFTLAAAEHNDADDATVFTFTTAVRKAAQLAKKAHSRTNPNLLLDMASTTNDTSTFPNQNNNPFSPIDTDTDTD